MSAISKNLKFRADSLIESIVLHIFNVCLGEKSGKLKVIARNFRFIVKNKIAMLFSSFLSSKYERSFTGRYYSGSAALQNPILPYSLSFNVNLSFIIYAATMILS